MYLQSATKLRLQGFEQFKWQRRKAWQQFRARAKEAWSKMELWSKSLKTIGGNFGMGIVAYFLFIKWLMFVNLCLFTIILTFVILPTITMSAPSNSSCDWSLNDSVTCCSELYANASTSKLTDFGDLMMGNGYLEYTLLFYGFYVNKIYQLDGFIYNLPLAYIAVTIALFICSLCAIVRSTAKGFKERVIENEGQYYKYCNLTFGGWDFCIDNEKSSAVKHWALFTEIKELLEVGKLEEEKQNRTNEEKTKLLVVRLFIHCTVIGVLVGCYILIFKSMDWLYTNSRPIQIADFNLTKLPQLFFEFLPYVLIVTLNVAVPILFRHLVTWEHYSPMLEIRCTLMRTIVLRLASLMALLVSFYKLINSKKTNEDDCYVTKADHKCWESFVGQQFLKLYLTDFIVQLSVTFVINFPRSLMAKTKSKILRCLGEQDFDLPKNVIDIVYSQSICWLGTFFAPILPLVAVVCLFFMFYIKKFCCLVNSKPSSKVYSASRSTSLFMFTLLVSYLLAVIPVGYSIAELTPSNSCGPFRGYETVWSVVTEAFQILPSWMREAVFFLSTPGFSIPCFVFLALLLYYYRAVALANKHMVTVLKNQLVLEGHDKQFLLNRLSAFIKQQQDQTKYQEQNRMGTFI